MHILTDNDITALSHKIDTEIGDICDIYGYEMQSIKLANWLFILTQLNTRIFKPHPEIIYNLDKAKGTGKTLIIDNLITLYYLYSSLCDRYGMMKRKRHFFAFVGVHRTVIYAPEYYKGENVRQKISSLRKIIEADCEESIVNAAVSDKGNPVKFLAILNHDYAWDKDGKQAEETPRQRISIADLPRLESSHNLPTASDDDSEEDF